MSTGYLERVLKSRVYEIVRETPLSAMPLLSERLGNRVLLKREDTQPVFSFKVRGAYNRMVRLDGAEAARGVVAAGGAGVAFGRNVWGSDDPAALVGRLLEAVHGAGPG